VACGNNEVSRGGLQTDPRPAPAPAAPRPGTRVDAAATSREVASIRVACAQPTPRVTNSQEAWAAVASAEKVLRTAQRLKGVDRAEWRQLIKAAEQQLEAARVRAKDLGLEEAEQHDRQERLRHATAEHLQAMRLGALRREEAQEEAGWTLLDEVLEQRSIPRSDLDEVLAQTLANPNMPEDLKKELPAAWRAVEAVSSRAPGTAPYTVGDMSLGRANPKGRGTMWIDTTRYRKNAHGFAYEMLATARLIAAPHSGGNGLELSIVAGRDQLIFGQKLPAGPERRHVEADVLIVSEDGRKVAVDTKNYAKAYGNSAELRRELDGFKHALRGGEVHEFHLVVRGRMSDEAKRVIEEADRSLREELQAARASGGPAGAPTIAQLQAQVGLDLNQPLICWHENLG
jgi:hypothetical protein